ncbi:MAG: lysophospholipid acyltransferase family protein [Bacillota bacterium]|nr:lysophospholipid acyltransferase family protein [Bacillota bacterium]
MSGRVTLAYRLARYLVTAVLKVLFFWKVEGRQHIPPQGPVLFCCNHLSAWDPPVVGCAATRQVYFMAKRELWRIPVLRSVIAALGAYPVDRQRADLSTVRRSLQLLEQGRAVGVFPEGTRSRTGQLGPLRTGGAKLALRTGAAVVPMAIVGPYRLFQPLHVRIGKPLYLGRDTNPTREKVRAVRDEMARAIAGLLEGSISSEAGKRREGTAG